MPKIHGLETRVGSMAIPYIASVHIGQLSISFAAERNSALEKLHIWTGTIS